MRVALDINVLISAIIKPENRIGMIVVRMRNGDYTLLYSIELINEFTEVVTRDRIWKKHQLTTSVNS